MSDRADILVGITENSQGENSRLAQGDYDARAGPSGERPPTAALRRIRTPPCRSSPPACPSDESWPPEPELQRFRPFHPGANPPRTDMVARAEVVPIKTMDSFVATVALRRQTSQTQRGGRRQSRPDTVKIALQRSGVLPALVRARSRIKILANARDAFSRQHR